jgi:hypothetical protein
MIFKIEKGEHYSKPNYFRLYFGKKEFNWEIKFSKSCYYDRYDVDKTGLNKLRGITFGTHQEGILGKYKLTKKLVNSVLLAWQPTFKGDNLIRIYAYYDVDGTEYKDYMCDMPVEEFFKVNFKVEKDGVNIKVNDFTKKVPVKTWLKVGYHLKPYFGGQSVAPKDMNIEIK